MVRRLLGLLVILGCTAVGGGASDTPAVWGIDGSSFATFEVGRVVVKAPSRPNLTLRLAAAGCRGAEERASTPMPAAHGPEIRYAHRFGWGQVAEWYRLVPRGLEQGFTLESLPACAGGAELALSIAFGAWSPRAAAGGGVELAAPGAGRAYRYAELHAFDATGRALPARMEANGEQVTLAIDARGAQAPVVVDPILSPAGELAAHGDVAPFLGIPHEQLGYAVSVSADGTRALVGAPHRFEPIDGGPFPGKGYVFVRSGSTWSLEQALEIDDPDDARVGQAVALSADGTRAIVGVPRPHEGGPGNPAPGSAFVFARSGSSWTLEQELAPASAEAGDWFGWAVAISEDGSRAMIGAPQGELPAAAGAMHVFTRTGSTWMEEQSITPADAASGDGFGSHVSLTLDATRALVSAPGHETASTTGAAYVLTRSGTAWSEEAQLEAGASGSAAIAGDGTRAVLASSTTEVRVYARSASTWALEQDLLPSQPIYFPGVHLSADGSRALVADSNCGGSADALCRVFVFERAAATWSETQVLTSGEVPDATLNGDAFGSGLAQSADGQRIVIGAPGSDAVKPNHGLVHVHVASGGAFAEEAELSPGDSPAGDQFGYSVAIDAAGTRAIIGAPLDDLPPNRDQGSASVFELGSDGWTESAKVFASDGEASDFFGWSASMTPDGARAIVGAPEGDVQPGQAYVLDWDGSTWAQQKLVAGPPSFAEFFGASVAIAANGTRAIVGAPVYAYELGGEVYPGRAYLFALEGATWALEQEISIGDLADFFGWSVGLSEDASRAIVGARGAGTFAGAAHVFVRAGSSWSLEQTVPFDVGTDPLGHVALSPDGLRALAAVAEPTRVITFTRTGSAWSEEQEIPTSGYVSALAFSPDGSRLVFGRPVDGEVDLYAQRGGGWVLDQTLASPAPASDDYFGAAASLSHAGATVVVGAPRHAGSGGLEGRAFVFTALADGAPCGAANECASGHCVDGVRCNEPCGDGETADCQACAEAAGAATDGVCGPVADGAPCDDADLCTTDACAAGVCAGVPKIITCPVDSCGVTGSCDPGTGQCTEPCIGESSSSGAAGAAPGASPGDDDGCGCKVIGAPPARSSGLVALAVALLAFVRRRRAPHECGLQARLAGPGR